VKFVVVVTAPPGPVILIPPVVAPVGTVAVTVPSSTTVKLACTPRKVTPQVCMRLTPVMVTTVPTAPLVGVKLLICGVTRNFLLLGILPLGSITRTYPVPAPGGTVAWITLFETTVKGAEIPLKVTWLAPVRFVPRMSMVAPTLP